jgi:hypothetical protein
MRGVGRWDFSLRMKVLSNGCAFVGHAKTQVIFERAGRERCSLASSWFRSTQPCGMMNDEHCRLAIADYRLIIDFV